MPDIVYTLCVTPLPGLARTAPGGPAPAPLAPARPAPDQAAPAVPAPAPSAPEAPAPEVAGNPVPAAPAREVAGNPVPVPAAPAPEVGGHPVPVPAAADELPPTTARPPSTTPSTSPVPPPRSSRPARPPRSSRTPEPPALLPAERGAWRRPGTPEPPAHPITRWTAMVVAFVVLTLLGAGGGALVAGIVAGVVVALLVDRGLDLLRSARLGTELDVLARAPAGLAPLAYAVADALSEAGLARASAGAGAVRLAADTAGSYRVCLAGVDAATSEAFVAALDDVVSPVAGPRYVIARYQVAPVEPGLLGRAKAGHAWRRGQAPSNTAVYHAVPRALGADAGRAAAFGRAWARWVSVAGPVDTSSPEGAAILAAAAEQRPFAAATAFEVAAQ